MILSKNNIAIVPARLNSKRLAKKNILSIKKKPIISWVLRKLIKSRLFSEIIVSSESTLIRDITKKEGVTYHNRPSKLSRDDSKVVDVCLDVLNNFEFQKNENFNFCCVYPTALFLTLDDLNKSYNKYKKFNYNTLISAAEYNLPPQQALKKKEGYWTLVDKKYKNIQSNFYSQYLCDAGMFYWSNKKYFNKYKTFYSSKLGLYKINRERICDLNTKEDLNYLLRNIKISHEKNKIFI